jgi:ABC-type multidrug transport system fused ATPase/permease subunit
MDYDRIIVMKNGQIIEQGRPYDLIKVEGGEFKKLYSKIGKHAH